MQKRFLSYLNTAQQLIESYKGEMPFANFLKNHFTQNKKYGATDRKQITHLCYCYFRLGKALAQESFETRAIIAYFLCNTQPNNYAFLFDDIWLKNWSDDIEKRIQFVFQCKHNFSINDIFVHNQFVSIKNKINFIKSHLIQPDLFVRIRPNYELVVKEILTKNTINFIQKNATCLAMPNGTKLTEIVAINKQIVIQDYSSQQVDNFMQLVKKDLKNNISVWDCCAASGGKSILAIDILGKIKLAVSDIRPSIIANLKKRFAAANITNFEAFIADVSKPIKQTKKYNFIICDAPCTGSGTWARTPEELSFFKEKSIDEFTVLQKNIATNALEHLQKKGYFLYITCSVFSKENEEVVNYLLQNKTLELVEQKYFEGFENKADTMFATLIKKTS